jgi:hypothetical protein
MPIRPKATNAVGTAQQRAHNAMKPVLYFATFAFRELFLIERPQVGPADPPDEQTLAQPKADSILVMLISFE